ncbi:hypothetical protein [Salisaeta longa]|uniref:hypothetical protein n=1 Tax=Salisaeta longa TaxID=503170 RepID=UPI0003B4DD76|nr:hypothetical protein [Salisaeta longa]
MHDDPFQVETKYQRLQADLLRPASVNWKLAQVVSFLECLPDATGMFETYVLEIQSILALLVPRMAPIGWAPERLHQLIDRLVVISDRLPSTAPGWPATLDGLRRATARLYAYAGAPRHALRVMHGTPFDESIHAEAVGDAPSGDVAPFNRLATLAEQSDGSDAERLRTLLDTWTEPLPEHPIPTVECLSNEAASTSGTLIDRLKQRAVPRMVGGFTALHVDLLGRRSDADAFTLEGYADATSTSADTLLAPVWSAVRDLLNDRSPTLAQGHWNGRVRLTAGPPVAGRSLHLALAVELMTVLQETHPQRVRLRPRSRIAFTGVLEANGAVRPVNKTTLPTKVQTAFFSPVTTLVVPDAQADIARAARDAHADRYPHGALTIVGVSSLRAVYHNRTLIRRVSTDRFRYVLRVARTYSTATVATVSGVMILLLLSIIAWMTIGPLDQNPVAVRFGGKHMILQNDNGQVVERVHVGPDIVRQAVTDTDGETFNAYALVDGDGDGQNEICWAGPRHTDSRNERQTHPLEYVQCRGVGDETVQWALPLRFEVPFSDQPELTTRVFSAMDLQAGDWDADGTPELYLTANHQPYFPGLLLKIDVLTGAVLQQYVHPGHLERLASYDLNGDGVREIMVPGVSNAFWEAVLAVLDPRDMDGHAPTQTPYAVRGQSLVPHIAYIRFPPTVVHTARSVNLNQARAVVSRAVGQRQFSVKVAEGTNADKKNGLHTLIHFTFDLEPRAMGTSSEYDAMARRLVDTGALEAVPTDGDRRAYLARLPYWTGTGWTTEPTVHWPGADSSRAWE